MAAAEHICHDGNERDALNQSSELNNKNWRKHWKTVDRQGIAVLFLASTSIDSAQINGTA
jgi:hypothetical protein